MFILLCIVAFIVSFIGSVIFKLKYTSPKLKKYSVQWSDKIGTVHKDIAYGDKAANKFDLYVPADNTKETYGLVVYLHAGGFTTGDKADDAGMLQWLCSKGYVAAGINYTLRDDKNPDASVYSQSMEIKSSMNAVVKAAAELGYNLDAMAISGGSAGGTLAMLYAYRDAGESPIPVKLLFEAVGPSSFYPEDWSVYGLDKSPEAAAGLFGIMAGTQITADMIGTEEYEAAVKPISAYMWVNETSVPTVCAYGAYDKVCPFDSAKHLIRALEENHVTHAYFEMPHSGHGLQNDTALYAKYMETVEEYLDTYLPADRGQAEAAQTSDSQAPATSQTTESQAPADSETVVYQDTEATQTEATQASSSQADASQTSDELTIEKLYATSGEHNVAFVEFEAEDDVFKKYEIWYPEDLESSDGKYPVIVMANGTGIVASSYKSYFEHLASWGFIVVGNEDENSRTGASSEASLTFLLDQNEDSSSIFYGKVDTDHMGIGGHSQGGVGAINAVTSQAHGNLYTALYTASATSPYWGQEGVFGPEWSYDLSKVNIPTFQIAGTGYFDAGTAEDITATEGQGICPLWSLLANYEAIPDTVDKVIARRANTDHGDTNVRTKGYMTAWFMWLLQGDEKAGEAFKGSDAELLHNSLYQDVQSNIS